MEIKKTELYRCQKCKKEWADKPGPVTCPACGNVWIDWLTYKKNFGDRIIKTEHNA
jgi:Zn-finger nucleic acid-binding protein